jgi:hypothetical protein
MADKRISELTSLSPVDDTDLIVVVDVSDTTMGVAGTTKKALKTELKGDKGDAATVDVGTTTTGNPGTNASVVNSGTTNAAIFDFTIPRGATGAQGIQGIQGTAGTNGTNGTNGTDGISYIWKGTYSAGTSYQANDCVAYLGTSYIYINATPGSGHTPADDAYWDILALKGNTGTGTGDVVGPATNTDSYIPQWNGANSKTLKDGLPITTWLKTDQTTPQTIANGQPIQDTLTASQIVATDANKKFQSLAVATYPSLTELSYVKGVTSAVQTQLNNKAGTGVASTSANGLEPQATAPSAGNLNVEGIANGETARSDKLLLDSTLPTTQAFSDSAVAGTSLKAARIDHKHAMPALDLSGYVTKSTYDAHTILYATTDNTPAALVVGEQTVVGRATGGNITALAIDSDLSSVSANDDTIPSAKATKAMGDSKLPLAGGTMTGKATNAGKDEVGKTYTPASGAQTVALDCSVNNIHIVSGNASGTAITFTITGATNSQVFIVSILQGDTTVSTITSWFSTIRWSGGSAPTLTATLNKRDTFGFIRTAADQYDGFVIGQGC